MKIRTDFVTNSSSSSFVAITVYTRNGKQYTFDHGMDSGWHEENMPVLKDGKLVYAYYSDREDADGGMEYTEIPSVQDLAAALYFNDCDDAADFNVISPLFGFLIGKLTGRKLIKALRSYEEFEELEDIDPADYEDREELREAILEVLDSVISDSDYCVDLEDEDLINAYKKFVRNVKSLSDIKDVVVNQCDTNWGEFTNSYVERLNLVLEAHPFAAVPVEDPSYEETAASWTKLLETEVLMGDVPLTGSPADLVKKALASGKVWDMIPETIQSIRSMVYAVSADE